MKPFRVKRKIGNKTAEFVVCPSTHDREKGIFPAFRPVGEDLKRYHHLVMESAWLEKFYNVMGVREFKYRPGYPIGMRILNTEIPDSVGLHYPEVDFQGRVDPDARFLRKYALSEKDRHQRNANRLHNVAIGGGIVAVPWGLVELGLLGRKIFRKYSPEQEMDKPIERRDFLKSGLRLFGVASLYGASNKLLSDVHTHTYRTPRMRSGEYTFRYPYYQKVAERMSPTFHVSGRNALLADRAFKLAKESTRPNPGSLLSPARAMPLG